MATRLSGRVRRLEQTRGACGGRGKVVIVYPQRESSLERSDRIYGLAEADDVPGCPGCGKQSADRD